MKMNAIQVSETGGPEVLHLVETTVPEPSTGQLLIRVTMAGVNYADIHQRRGTYPAPGALPMTPGWEVAGVVAAHGQGVSTPPVGARVVASLSSPGGYAEYAVADASAVFALPDGVEEATALALLGQGLTAYFLLTVAAPLEPDQSVLVHAAAGGVGSLAVQLARALGAGSVIGTASQAAKREAVLRLGADHVFDYTQSDWPAQVKNATVGKGVDVILDAVGGAITAQGLTCLAPFGRLVTYGATGDVPMVPNFTGEQITCLIFANQSIVGMALQNILGQPGRAAQALNDLLRRVVAGELSVLTGDRFPLAQAAQAHRAIEERHTTGKVVLISSSEPVPTGVRL